jgi:hypothetical protein
MREYGCNSSTAHTHIRIVSLNEEYRSSMRWLYEGGIKLPYFHHHDSTAATLVLRLTFDDDESPPTSPALLRRLNGSPHLKHFVVVLPKVARSCAWDMKAVVVGVRYMAERFLSADPTLDARFTLVGAERFGICHFGVTDDTSTPQAAVQQTFGAPLLGVSRRLNANQLQRFSCLSFQEWYDSEPNPLVRGPPPDLPYKRFYRRWFRM